ncbi:MAG: glycosyltransferase family 39 protein [Anaerolineae bacterium]|nr:glycosyltransferase family 39 protein [Anaerolineae bacterium]
MIDLLVDILLAGLMMAALYGIGCTVYRLTGIAAWSHSAELALAFGFGLGIVFTLLFLLGVLGLLYPAAGWILLGVGLSLAGIRYRTLMADSKRLWQAARTVFAGSWFVKIVFGLGLVFVLMNLIGDLAPPVEGDTVQQYLIVPRYWVDQHRYIQPEHIWAGTLPGNMMMISAWAMLLRRSFSLATLITGFGMSLLLALGVYALARLYFEPKIGAIAAVIITTMPDAVYLAQSGKVDMGWAFFEALALAAFFRWMDLDRQEDPKSDRWLLLAGVFLGLAAGSKNQTWISVALLGGWLVLYKAFAKDWAGLLKAGLIFGLGTLAAALPYYLYNGIVHYNPFYPVFAGPTERWFGATPSPRSELGTEVFYPWSVGGYFANLWNASLGHTDPSFYLGFIAGPVFLLAIPIGALLGVYRGKREIWRMLGYAFVFSIVWFLVKQAARHYLPGWILLSVASAVVFDWLSVQRGWQAWITRLIAIFVLVGNLSQGLGMLYWNGAWRVAFGLESRDQYLERFFDEVAYRVFPDWETIGVLNDLSPSEKVLAEHASYPLYIKPYLVSGQWGMRERLDTITDGETLADLLEAQEINYILVYNVDPDDNVLFTEPEFLSTYARLVYDGPRTRLYQLTWTERE